MNRERRLAFLVLKDIEDKQSWINLALGSRLADEKDADAAFVRELVYGCVRNQFLLDYNIKRFLKKPKLSASEKVLLRMGFYQLALMDGVAEYAAINETVGVAAAFLKGKQGFINAILRSFQRSGKELLWDSLSTKYSCAQWIIDLWEKAYGKEKTEELLRASNTKAPFTVRTNTLKNSRDELKEKLEKLGFNVRETELSALCLEVSGSGILDTDLYKQGFFSVQGEASANAVEMLAPKAGDTVLDLCAAPGGKSCAAAELIGSGLVRSFDIHAHRVELILAEAKRLGLSNVTAEVMDSSVFIPELAQSADCVIADVPCSGLGTLRRNPEIKLKNHSDKESKRMLEELSKIQYNVLVNAIKYVKPQGKVLYSSCTINPQENAEVVERVAKEFGVSVESEQQLFTTEGGPDGFFTCILRRIDDKRRL